MLILRIDRYLRARRMAPTRFGREALGDPNFVFNLREGRCPRPSTVKRVEAWLDAHEDDRQVRS